MNLPRRAVVAAGAAWLAAGPAGARSAGAGPASLVVFAAADLALAFRELALRFEAQQGARLTLTLGSTGHLAAQIEHGAPADVFFAADEAVVARLVASGTLAAASSVRYADGRLALVTSRRHGLRLATLEALDDPRVRHVALANPAHAPYGRAARETLERAGLWPGIRKKLVYGENVRQALQFVESGAAEAGLVARSVAEVPAVAWVPVDPRLHAPIRQAAGVLTRSPRPALAGALLGLVTGPAGRAILERYGFAAPGEA